MGRFEKERNRQQWQTNRKFSKSSFSRACLFLLPSLIGVLVLSPMVYKCTKNYIDRHVRHLDVEPMLSVHEDIQREQAMALEAEQKALAKVGIDSDYAE